MTCLTRIYAGKRAYAVVGALFAAGALTAAAPAGAANVNLSGIPALGSKTNFQQPRVAADPTNPQRFVATFQEEDQSSTPVGGAPLWKKNECYVATSTNAGASWSHRPLIGAVTGSAYPNPSASSGPNVECMDPQVSFGPDGTIYYLFETRNMDSGGGRRVFLTTSPDFGASWTAPKEVPPPGPAGVTYTDLWSSLAVDRNSGRVHVAWLRYCTAPSTSTGVDALPQCLPNPLRIYLTSSDDKGRTFNAPSVAGTVPVEVDPTAVDPGRTSLAVDRVNGTVSVAWVQGAGADASPAPPNSELLVASSSDGGKTFLPSRPVAVVDGGSTDKTCNDLRYTQHSEAHGFFQLLAGEQAGKLYVARWDVDPATQRCRVFFQSSSNGGLTWSIPVTVGANQDEQHRPRLALLGGKLYMVYYNIDPTNNAQNAYLATSTNDGVTWSPQKISDVPSNATVGPHDRPATVLGGSALADFGEWPGIDVSSAGVVAAWTDGRDGNPDQNVGGQDVYSNTSAP